VELRSYLLGVLSTSTPHTIKQMPVRLFCWLGILVAMLVPASGQQSECPEVQKRLDRVQASGSQITYDTSWHELDALFGKPTKLTQDQYGGTFEYAFSGCSVQFYIGSKGKVVSKSFKFRPTGTLAASQPAGTTPTQAALTAHSQGSDLANTVLALQTTLRVLEARIVQLEKSLSNQAAASPTPPPEAPVMLVPPTDLSVTTPRVGTASAHTPSTLPASSAVTPSCAENASCYGDISTATGRAKTVHVDGYTRKDGTYVRGHYRSAPRSPRR
jgi:hypothetical protein